MFRMNWGKHKHFNLDNARKRFLDKTTQGNNGCIVWVGSIGSHKRYGTCGLAGRHWLAHRAAWFLFRGEDPGKRVVCHSCDNGLCVNPDHLFLGSQNDNILDMEQKGRSNHPKGAAHGRAVLTWEQVNEIRERHASGQSARSMAKIYGVSKSSVLRIVNNKGWLPHNSGG